MPQLLGKCTRGVNCKFLHKNSSPKPPDKQKKINKVCMYWKKGKCTRGDKCRFLHKSDKDRTPSPSRPAQMRKPPPQLRATPAASGVHAAAASNVGYVPQGKGLKNKPIKKARDQEHSDRRSRGKLISRPRRYTTCCADQADCPKPCQKPARYAAEAASEAARLLEQAVKAMIQGIPSSCDYECPSTECEDFGTTCQHCEEVSKRA